MTAAPLVTIGMAVYNGERYIQEALDSVLAQPYRNIEVIVADDASVDATATVCEDYARRDGRIRVHRHRRNIGMSANFDWVLAEARGTYFTYLAQDDGLEPAFLPRTVDYLDAHPDVVLCGSAMKLIDDRGHPLGDLRLDVLSPALDWRRVRPRFFCYESAPRIVFTLYGLYRRAALRGLSFGRRMYRGRPVMQDLERPWLARVARRGRIVALPETLRRYRWYGESSFQRERARLSPWSVVYLAHGMRLRLLGLALGLPVGAWPGVLVRSLGSVLWWMLVDLAGLLVALERRTMPAWAIAVRRRVVRLPRQDRAVD
jgi:glycosyltransferase involved in cell wall biosynthesis